MRPIMINGHERSLTKVKYNTEGDLLFSVSKDSRPSVWFSHNGERLGTYNGHNGTVWCCDVDYTTTLFGTGSADNSCRIWDVETGTCLRKIDTKSAVRTCNFSYDGSKFFYTTDSTMGQKCTIFMYDVARLKQEGDCDPTMTIEIPDSKVTASTWGLFDETILTGHENGDIRQWDLKTQDVITTQGIHDGLITDMQPSKDMTMFIASSKDHKATLFDMEDLSVVKQFATERPVNSATISPLKEHVILGGGQEAKDVTMTAGKVGKFDARFFHMVFGEEIGRVKGHFGPINTVAFHPNGKSYVSGGEDGYIRIHKFDSSYFKFEFEH